MEIILTVGDTTVSKFTGSHNLGFCGRFSSDQDVCSPVGVPPSAFEAPEPHPSPDAEGPA